MNLPVLVLNSSYEVLNITNIRRALKLVFGGKAEAVQQNGVILHTPSRQYTAPAVIRLHYFVRIPFSRIPLTKKNVLYRDNFTCQYCGKKSLTGMTLDHLIPKSLGGRSCWENVVCACPVCNNKKGDRSLQAAGMQLLKQPGLPKFHPFVRLSLSSVPKAWRAYLSPYLEKRWEAYD